MKTIKEFRERQAEITSRVTELNNESAGQRMSDEAKAEWNTLNEEFDANLVLIEELDARESRVAILEQRGQDGTVELGAHFNTRVTKVDNIYDLNAIRQASSSIEHENSLLQDNAKRALERAVIADARVDESYAKAHVDRLIRRDGEHGEISRRILSTGNPVYERAFVKVLAGREAQLTGEERTALSTAGADGGFAVPFALDPTVIPTSNHSVNPYRAISSVKTITGSNTWEGISSAGVTVAYASEATEASDNSPTIAQPSATVVRCQGFIQFSVEIEGDWAGMFAELAIMLGDAKDDVEASKFTTGSGTAEPQGVVTGIGTAAFVLSAGTAAYTAADIDALEAALGARFRARASFVAARPTYQATRHFDTAGGAQLWIQNLRLGIENQVPTPGNVGATLIGYPAFEATSMDSAPTTTGQKPLLMGDFSKFVLVDRVGMNLELVQHIVGANRRPTGERGLFAWWRNTSLVTVPGAFKLLKIK